MWFLHIVLIIGSFPSNPLILCFSSAVGTSSQVYFFGEAPNSNCTVDSERYQSFLWPAVALVASNSHWPFRYSPSTSCSSFTVNGSIHAMFLKAAFPKALFLWSKTSCFTIFQSTFTILIRCSKRQCGAVYRAPMLVRRAVFYATC